MQIFDDTAGKHEKSYGDDIIQLRFRCSKRKNDPPYGELLTLLTTLKLTLKVI